ncbi:hypothetical protein [Nonomuraea sp. NPDC050310]|uniref:hypothetical protein n=1 Tax=unclassified Nonomuraea TaxID=2593643 RepID=UPI0033CEC778
MNVIQFEMVPPLRILIDGRDLREHVRIVELPFATAEGKPDLAGSYKGLSERDKVCWPSTHFLGRPLLQWLDDGDTVLLGCTCGEWECWPLTAQVQVGEETVTWSGFRNGHRASWDLGALGPFTFDREQYESALRRTARRGDI